MTISDSVTFTRHNDIGVLKIDRPPVNALSRDVLKSLLSFVIQVDKDDSLQALVVCAAGKTFVCGADIDELSVSAAEGGDHFNPVMDALERLTIPAVAVLHGTALGGGLELAMACHYRVALPGTRVGLPEVLLGVLPGAGGTQRLPRLIGVKAALDMISTGKMIDADQALKLSLLDAIQEGDPAEVGLDYAQRLLEANKGPVPSRAISIKTDDIEPDYFSNALAKARKNANYPAAERIVRCVEAAVMLPFEQGQRIEQTLFEECRDSNTAKALRHLFFAEREAAKVPNLPKDLALRPVKHVGVVGAGTMGCGIIMNFLNAGIPSIIVETSSEALDRGVQRIRNTYESSASRGRMTQEQVEERMSLLNGTLEYGALSDCDLVIEAVFENMEIKKQVCARLGEVCKAGAIIATNTSTLDVDVLAQASGRPADFVGMHFFSPANIMKLLEIVRGAETSPDILATVLRLARNIKKVPVVSGVCYGFIGNRMLEGYLREVDFLLMEGATPSQIDRVIEEAGLAMGPCRMLDMAGIDVAAKIVLEQEQAGIRPTDPSYRAAVLRLHEVGRNGQKSGAGYYRYENRTPVEDPEALAHFETVAQEHSFVRRKNISNQEIFERCMYPLINEGVKILEEGVAYRPGDIDVVWTRGYGFGDHLGGPIFLADQIGLREIQERLSHYASERGNSHGYWTPAALLVTLSDQGKTLSGWAA